MRETVLASAVGAVGALRVPSPTRGRTLVVRSTSIGDFAVFLPFLASVYQQRGREQVDLLTISRTGDVAAMLLGAVRGAVIDPGSAAGFRAQVRAARAALAPGGYSEILYASQNSDSLAYRLNKLLTARAVGGWRARLRGVSPVRGIRTRADLLTHPEDVAVNQALAPFVACGLAPSATRQDVLELLGISEAERAAARAKQLGATDYAPGKRHVAMYVHAKDERKRWPPQRYVEVARAILRDPGASLSLVGGRDDMVASLSVAEALASERVAILAGALSIRETVALLMDCELFVGNDGSPAHLAALAGCAVISLFCTWENAGLWEPIAARASLSVRPEESARVTGDYGIAEIPTWCVERAVALAGRNMLGHRRWAVGSADEYDIREDVFHLSPYARSE